MTKRSISVVKILAIVAILVLAMSMVFVGCDKLKDAGKPEAEVGVKTITILIGTQEEYTTLEVNTSEEYMASLLLTLQEENKISNYTYTGSTTNNDVFISTINDIPGNVSNSYVAVYHTINEVELAAPGGNGYDDPVTVGTKTLYYSNVGVGLLPIRDGAIYAFLLATY
ncbi:MAG: hypothetical protein IJ226_04310 [Clostridia bacterium]|nr:hypothetical protein [Clostridia bacterium]